VLDVILDEFETIMRRQVYLPYISPKSPLSLPYLSPVSHEFETIMRRQALTGRATIRSVNPVRARARARVGARARARAPSTRSSPSPSLRARRP